MVHPVGRASDASGAAVKHVRVDHCCADVPVAEQLLDGANAVPVLREVGGEGVAQRVRRGAFRDANAAHGILDGALEDGLVEGWRRR